MVRFLMYYLDDICRDHDKWRNRDAKGREAVVKEMFREGVSRLKIFVITCSSLRDVKVSNERRVNRIRKDLEDCLIKELNPVLN
ncbi:MAG: hypothetical protein ACP5NQ_09050 [Vulcanisaeta sp.]